MIIVGLCAVANAGAWGRDPGSAWVQLAWRHDSSVATFDEQGVALPLASPSFLGDTLAQRIEDGRYDSDTASVYGEVGLLPYLTAVGSLPVRVARSSWTLTPSSPLSPVRHPNAGLGDLEVGARTSAPLGPINGGLTALLRVPLYDNSPRVLRQQAGNSNFFDDRVPLGPGTIDLDLLAAAGTGVAWGWAQIEAGVRVRDRQYSTVPVGHIELGGRPWDWIAGVLRLAGQTHLADGDQPAFFSDSVGRGPLIVDRARSLTVSGGALVRPSLDHPWGGALDLSHVVAGQRAGRVTSVQLAVTWETP